MTQTITINNIANNIASEMTPHDSLIGILLKNYNLPEDGSAKGDRYDKEMIEILRTLNDDIEERLEDFDTELRMNTRKFDENAEKWWSAWVDMYEALHEALDEAYDEYDDNKLTQREYLEVVYQNYHGCMEAGYDGAKMIAMFASILGE